MRTETNHEVGKLINYFENCINDLNKEFPACSSSTTATTTTKTSLFPPRTTSQNTSHLTLSFAETPQPTILPTIIDDEDIYDRLTYQTLIPSNSYSSHEHLSVKSAKRRRQANSHHTNKKRLHRRRPPTYIKELKAYLAHRESSVHDLTKINDIKKFSNVLVWLSNQTSTPTSLQKIEDSPSITPDSVIAITQSDFETTDEGQTKKSLNYLTYQNVPWKLKIRKEVFSPTETFDKPLIIELLYLQIVHDIFSSNDMRISEAERTNMKTFLSLHGVSSIANVHVIKSLTIKKDILEQARQWSIYFCRLFPIRLASNEIQILGLSHSGIRLIQRHRTIFQVLETFSFEMIQRVTSNINDSTMSLYLAKKKLTIQSYRIRQIQEMINKFLREFHAITPTPVDLEQSSSQISLMSCSQSVSELDIHTSKSNGYQMMEYALKNFQIPDRGRSKKSWKTCDWTWQDYASLLRWSKSPIQISLLRQSSNFPTRLIRQCFLAIMRFMGDYPLTRSQTMVNCVIYLLKNLRKHRKLIDEIFCQVLKQITENQNSKIESLQRGWKLLAILLNYYLPSDEFQPYFMQYLNDHRNEHEKLVKLCLDHYEQTSKYGGRKMLPNKMEIELLTSTSRNEGKRQLFLLPGGFSLTISITSSMIIRDCLHLLCNQLKISNISEEEYSIFIIGTSKYTSRLLNPTEYIFDILNEYIRSNINSYHLIIKRTVWFDLPLQRSDDSQSDMFVDFMYHQLIPEFLEGTLIVLTNNHLSDESMQEISLMATLQYHVSNKTDLPSMKEVKHLLPGTVLKIKSIHPQQWIAAVHEHFLSSVQAMAIIEAKKKFLDLIQTWPLFGTTLFSVQSVHAAFIRSPCLIGVNQNGLLFLDVDTRETILTISYNDLATIRRHQMTVDINYGHPTPTHHLQCQIDRAQELVTLTGRYLAVIDQNKKNDIQQLMPLAYKDSISTIL